MTGDELRARWKNGDSIFNNRAEVMELAAALDDRDRLEMATVFQIKPYGTSGHGYITVERCEGYRLPKQPYMWAVRWIGNVLGKDGEWEYEPQPSSRTDAFYSNYRFDTLDSAIDAARGKS